MFALGARCVRVCVCVCVHVCVYVCEWEREGGGGVVGCLLNVPAACEYISGTDLLRQFTCCHTEIEVADQIFHLTQSQYTDTRPTSPSTDPITPGAWQGSHWECQFLSHWYDSTLKKSQRKQDSNPGSSTVKADALPLGQWGDRGGERERECAHVCECVCGQTSCRVVCTVTHEDRMWLSLWLD